MKKLLILLLAVFLCSPSSLALTFTDANGREVEIENPKRVISLYNSYGDAWLTAGGNLVGSIADSFQEESLPDPGIQNLGSHLTPNMELLFSLNPDFVLLSSDVSTHGEIAEILESAHIPHAFFSAKDWRGYMDNIRLFTRITGREDLFQQQVEMVQKPIEVMIDQAQALNISPSALLIRAHSTAVKARNSESTVAGHILRDMGFINLADENSILCEGLSMEKILVEDPDYIFVILQGTSSEAAEKSLAAILTGNPAWNTLSAVRNENFYILDRELFHYHPNSRWAESYEFILKVLKGEA